MQKEVIASGMGEGTSLGFHQHLGEKGENRTELSLRKRAVMVRSSGFGFKWTWIQILHWPLFGFFGKVS